MKRTVFVSLLVFEFVSVFIEASARDLLAPFKELKIFPIEASILILVR